MSRWRTWGEIPTFMKNDFTLKYYRHLSRKRTSMVFKRIFDVIMSAVLLVLLSPVILVLAVWIKVDSRGPVFFRQERITQYGRKFRIFKFRTMVNDADKKGSLVTVGGDSRITRVGAVIRKYRLDEIPQLINVLCGDMSFVGTRPEVEKYVMARQTQCCRAAGGSSGIRMRTGFLRLLMMWITHIYTRCCRAR